MGHAFERCVESPVSRLERCARVDVAGRAETFGDGGQRQPFRMELAGDNGECVHGLRSGGCAAGAAGGAALDASDAADDDASGVVAGGAGSFKAPFTPQAASGTTPTATAMASPMAARRIRPVKSRNIGAES
jgi:hypothetical protein